MRYGEELANVMKKALLIGKVASLAREIKLSKINLGNFGFHVNTFEEESESGCTSSRMHSENDNPDLGKAGILNGIDISSRRARINQLLGEWEEVEDTKKVVSRKM